MINRTTVTFFFVRMLLPLSYLICFFTAAGAQQSLREIVLELQDRRSFGNADELGKYLMSTDSSVRLSALYAMGNIGDSNSVSRLNYLLAGPFDDYPNTGDMKAAAFVLGQIPCEESRKFARLELEDNSATAAESRKYFLDALGRIGDSTDLALVSRFAYSTDTGITRAAAMSIARFGLRRIKSDASVNALIHLVQNSNDPVTLENCAFAFWRTNDNQLLAKAEREIYNLAESKDPQTRMWAFNALAKLGSKVLLMYMMESFLSEDDWRVRVNILNSLGSYIPDSLTDMSKQINTFFITATGDENDHVTLVAIEAAGRFFPRLESAKGLKWKEDAAVIFRKILDEQQKYSEVEAGAAAVTLSKLLKDRAKDDLFSAFRKSNSYRIKADVLRAFGEFDNGEIYKQVRDTVTAEVMRYNEINPNKDGRMIGSEDLAVLYRGFVEMMSAIDNKLGSDDQKISRLIFLEFAGSKDPLITAVSLDALQDSIYLNERSEIASVMKFDLGELKLPDDRLIILMFIDAFKNIGVKDAAELLEPLLASGDHEIAKASAEAIESLTGKKKAVDANHFHDFDWDFMNSMKGSIATLKTSAGDIRLELFSDIAPFTVQNFIKLAQKDFFDSTKFHRVVSNFVIQGGDPTSSGYGGPEHSIRSEFSDLSYDTGVLGMASSGKDTEGSQFFITHSRTPHLDGRYTIFGRVIDGMEFVNKVMAGDVLYDVIIEKQ